MPNKQLIFDKKNVLILGGAGFLGSHLCDELVKDSKVICVDNFSTGEEKNIDHLLSNPNFKFIKHDMVIGLELDKFTELADFKVEFQGVQEIYNLACPTSPVNFVNNRLATALANSLAVKNALDLAVKYHAKFLQFSSSVVYGNRDQHDNKKVNEDNLGTIDFLSDRASYDEGKRFAETLIKTYRESYKVDAKIMRLFRVYGPRMPLNQGHMLPDFISSALDNKDMIVFGDAGFSSSFCYVSDVIDAAIKLMKSDQAGPINIGSDIDVNITDVAKKIINITGSQSKIVYAEKMLFMTPLCLPDISKARDLLNWLPLITLDKGLADTVEDLRSKKGAKKIDYSQFL